MALSKVLVTELLLSNVTNDKEETSEEEESPAVLVEAKAVGPAVKAAIRDNRET